MLDWFQHRDQNKVSMIAQRRRSRLSFTAYSDHGILPQARGKKVTTIAGFLLTTTLTITDTDAHSVGSLPKNATKRRKSCKAPSALCW